MAPAGRRGPAPVVSLDRPLARRYLRTLDRVGEAGIEYLNWLTHLADCLRWAPSAARGETVRLAAHRRRVEACVVDLRLAAAVLRVRGAGEMAPCAADLVVCRTSAARLSWTVEHGYTAAYGRRPEDVLVLVEPRPSCTVCASREDLGDVVVGLRATLRNAARCADHLVGLVRSVGETGRALDRCRPGTVAVPARSAGLGVQGDDELQA